MNTLDKLISTNFHMMVMALMLITFSGCAAIPATKSDSTDSTVRIKSIPRTELAKTSPWENTARKFLEEAHAFKENGEVRNSLEYLKIVLTIDPSNVTVREEMSRLILERTSEAEKYFKAGNAVRSSNPKEASRYYIAALRIRSDYSEALAALREIHLAKAEASLQTRLKKEAAQESLRSKGEGQSEDEDIDVANYSLEVAVLSYEDGDYIVAIREFEKIKSRYPNDKDIQLYLNSSYYNVGISWLSKKEYRKALSWFTKVNKGFERVEDYINNCRQNLKDSTAEIFQAGLKLYQENKYKDAIEEWKSVLEINPGHKQAKEYIKKVNKKMQDLRKKSR